MNTEIPIRQKELGPRAEHFIDVQRFILRAPQVRVWDIYEISLKIAEVFGVTMKDLNEGQYIKGRRRTTQRISRARWALYWYCYTKHKMHPPDIARRFNVHRGTIHHGLRMAADIVAGFDVEYLNMYRRCGVTK